MFIVANSISLHATQSSVLNRIFHHVRSCHERELIQMLSIVESLTIFKSPEVFCVAGRMRFCETRRNYSDENNLGV